MEWFKQHADTLVILSSFALCFWHLNEKINSLDKEVSKELAIIKTVLLIKNIMPSELANKNEEIK
jgi:hypothetical protein